MKKFSIIMLSFIMITGLSTCDTEDRDSLKVPDLCDNAAANAFKKLLPMTVTMFE